VFAWCVSLWETLYGAKPFGGDSPAELAIQVATGRLVEPPDQRGVPRWLRNILTRGLRPEPDDRWASMTDVRRALDRARVVRRRRLALAGVAVVGGVGLGVFGSLMARDRRIVSGCEQSAAGFDAHWNPQRRAALEQAFAALELPYGNQSAQRLGQRLDEYVAQWRAAENESCLATELTGEISAQERALTRACLQDRMANIGSMLDQLEHVDPVAAAQAAGWSANLPPVADCRDPDQLAPYRDLPQGAAQDAEAIRAQLWRARTLLALGKPDEAVEPAAEAVARADAVSWPAMQAEALLLQASVRADRGDTPGARDLYQTAFGIAGEAHRDDLLLEIVHRLMFLEGVRMSNFEEAGVWTDVGRMLIRRQGIEDDPRASAFHLAHAAVLRSTAKYPEAAEEVQRALDLAEAATGVDHPANVPAMHTLAVLEFRLGKLDDAQSMLEHLLELIEADVGTKHPKYADVLVTLATVVDARGNPERGLALATESIELMRSARGPDHPTLVPLLSTAGAIALELGRLEQAADFMGRALELSERSEPTHLHHAELRINLAFIQLQLERFDAAERLSQRAIDTIEQLDLPDHPALTQAYAAHAAALLALQRYDQAAEEFDRVMHMPAWESAPPDVAAGITEGLAEAKQKGGRSSQ
jgi:tetratricopeptide (TPR) repeat protein